MVTYILAYNVFIKIFGMLPFRYNISCYNFLLSFPLSPFFPENVIKLCGNMYVETKFNYILWATKKRALARKTCFLILIK
jgi:hypothetical protein